MLQNHIQGIKKNFFIEVQLLYNVVLLIVSAVQQSESIIRTDGYMLNCSVLFDSFQPHGL